MKASTVLLVGAGAAVLYFLWTKARTIQNLQFVPLDIGMAGGNLRLTLGVQNPTSNSLTLRSLIGQILVNNAPIANVSNFTPTVIQPNSQTPITVDISANIFGLVSSVVSDIQNGFQPNQSIQFVGTANVDNSALPVKTNFS